MKPQSTTPDRAVDAKLPAVPVSPLKDNAADEVFEDAPMNQGLLTRRRKRVRDRLGASSHPLEWLRPYWLGSSLFLILFAFWLLDSLKDPLFARLVDGKIERHQPPAKICSVATTLVLVCCMEYLANVRKQKMAEESISPPNEVLDAGGVWTSMPMDRREHRNHAARDDTISVSMFMQIGIPYAIAFVVISGFVVQFEAVEEDLTEGFDAWYILGYVLFATVESFGSIAVATFWSYTNSTLSLHDAERYYGPIIAIAQLGAIGGSTLVASDYWRAPSLFIVVSLTLLLQVLLMRVYDRRFKPTSILAADDDDATIQTWQDTDATLTKPFWSGLYLVFQHYYVLLILGVSCLYEVSLTCLDYQMKLLGYARFELNDNVTMSFSEFMGRYGQVVNVTSLVLSSIVFPWLIRRFGLRKTLRIFPSLLLVVTIVAYGALPGNLAVLFFSLATLKAMTYSVHDPAKEILYIPTSNAVKFRSKFWIDVVGERISKAIGSGFNTLSGSVEQSVRVGSLPSILSAFGLWCVCFYVGIEFDQLLRKGKIVGLEQSLDASTYKKVPREEGRDEPVDEVEIIFCDESVSTIGQTQHESSEDEHNMVEMKPFIIRI